jgi:hypothetical protein
MADTEDTEKYDEFMMESEQIIRSKGFDILVEEVNDDEHLVIRIMKDGESVGSLSIIKRDDSGIYDKSKTGSQTRHQVDIMYETDNEVFFIPWLGVSEEYRGRNLGILLLIYGICFMKHRFNHVMYVKLDDDSGNASSIESNIYNRIGFGYSEHTSLDIRASTQRMKRNKLSPHGPEKQLLLQDNEIKKKIKRVLDEITQDDVAHKGGRKTKCMKTIKKIKTQKRKYKKSRKNKKQKYKKSRKYK